MRNGGISKVYLLSVPLEIDYKHVLYFSDKSNQESYFKSKIVKSYENFTYLRKDNIIHVPDHYDEIYNVNYVMYQNSRYNNKWFYAFVKNITYENDECTILEIETDVMQTWMFDYTIKPSFIEREHVNDDTIGLHTIPEGLETGEYTLQSIQSFLELTDSCVVVAMTINPETMEDGWGNFNANKYDGVGYYIFKGSVDSDYSGGSQVMALQTLLEKVAEAGKTDSIISMFMAPRKMVNWTGTGEWKTCGTISLVYRQVDENIPSYEPYSFSDFEITKPTTIDGYKPKNNKLFTHEYNYFCLTNNNGGNVIYHYEDFKNNPTFKIKGTISPSCSIRAIPSNYKNQSEVFNEGLTCGKFPVCSWMNDVYVNWLTQNGVNVALQTLSGIGQVVGSAVSLPATGAMGVAGIGNGLMNVMSTLGSVYQHSLIPPQCEGNINSADIGFSCNKNTFEAYKIQIRKEYAKVIDKFFSAYGYKVNDTKIPNKNHRENYWYTKTISIAITGSIPQNDIEKIKSVYDNGVTFWKNPANIKNYDVSNEIV